MESESETTSGALIPNEKRPPPAPPVLKTTNTVISKPIRRQHERAILEIRLKEQNINCWKILETLKSRMEQGQQEFIDQWLVHAKILIEEFRAVKSLFPSEKGRRITWYDESHGTPGPGSEGGGLPRGPKKKRKYEDVDSRVEEIEGRLQDNQESIENPGTMLCVLGGLL
jgi:hypothetical protein